MSDEKQRKRLREEGGPSNSPLKSVFDSSHLSGSSNVQDGGQHYSQNKSWIALQNTSALQASIRPEKKPLNTILDF